MSEIAKPVCPYNEKNYLEAKAQGLDLDDWNDYQKFFGIGEQEEEY